MTTLFAEVSDARIAYEVRGVGPALLCIMGFTGARYQWMGFPWRFADRFTVVAFDNRGVGASGSPPGPYSTSQMADDALAVMDAAGIERASVVGVSMGGMIAQELTLRAPGRVDRLVLGCTHHGGPGQVAPRPEVLARMAPRRGRSQEETLRNLLSLNFSPAYIERNAALIDEMTAHGLASKMHSAGFMGQLAALASHDAEARIGAIQHPTLVLTGDADVLVPPDNSRLIAGRIAGSRLRQFAGVGHMFWVEAADEAAGEIGAFLGGRPRPAEGLASGP